MNLELLKTIATSCHPAGSSFLSFPTWYEYLPGIYDPVTKHCAPQLTSINDVWSIVAAIIDILLRFAAILAFVFIIYGGVQYILSQGSPEKTDQARKTVISAVVGLVIALSGTVLVSFIGRKLG